MCDLFSGMRIIIVLFGEECSKRSLFSLINTSAAAKETSSHGPFHAKMARGAGAIGVGRRKVVVITGTGVGV